VPDARSVALAVALFVTVPASWLLVTIRLGFAYRSYLRLDHAWAVVLCSQLIAALACLFVLIIYSL